MPRYDYQPDPVIEACRARLAQRVRHIDPNTAEGRRIASELERDFAIKKQLSREVILVDGYTQHGVAFITDDELVDDQVVIQVLDDNVRIERPQTNAVDSEEEPTASTPERVSMSPRLYTNDKQRRIRDAVLSHREMHGRWPSSSELERLTGIGRQSLGATVRYCAGLERRETPTGDTIAVVGHEDEPSQAGVVTVHEQHAVGKATAVTTTSTVEEDQAFFSDQPLSVPSVFEASQAVTGAPIELPRAARYAIAHITEGDYEAAQMHLKRLMKEERV